MSYELFERASVVLHVHFFVESLRAWVAACGEEWAELTLPRQTLPILHSGTLEVIVKATHHAHARRSQAVSDRLPCRGPLPKPLAATNLLHGPTSLATALGSRGVTLDGLPAHEVHAHGACSAAHAAA